MYSSRNSNVKYFYLFCAVIFLGALSMILADNTGYAWLIPDFSIMISVYAAAYFDVFVGAVFSYAVFYLFGSLTALNPAFVSFAGIISYSVAYALWKRTEFDNVLSEFAITFFSFAVYLLLIFLAVYYGAGISVDPLYFLVLHGIPSGIVTAACSPLIFYVFKKIGPRAFWDKGRLSLT